LFDAEPLQLGKSSETTDEEYQEYVANFNKQQVCALGAVM
jgi:hypothetical protein